MPTLPAFAFWWMVFAVCGGLHWGSSWLLLLGLAVPVVALAGWALRLAR